MIDAIVLGYRRMVRRRLSTVWLFACGVVACAQATAENATSIMRRADPRSRRNVPRRRERKRDGRLRNRRVGDGRIRNRRVGDGRIRNRRVGNGRLRNRRVGNGRLRNRRVGDGRKLGGRKLGGHEQRRKGRNDPLRYGRRRRCRKRRRCRPGWLGGQGWNQCRFRRRWRRGRERSRNSGQRRFGHVHGRERHDVPDYLAAFVELHLRGGQSRDGGLRARRDDGGLLCWKTNAVRVCPDVRHASAGRLQLHQ